jgi:hypothetical protein
MDPSTEKSDEKSFKHKKYVGMSTAQYARKTLGFYPTTLDKSDSFADLTEYTIQFLIKHGISGFNAREKYGVLSDFALNDLSVKIKGLFPDLQESERTSMAFATVFSCVGRHESFKGRK